MLSEPGLGVCLLFHRIAKAEAGFESGHRQHGMEPTMFGKNESPSDEEVQQWTWDSCLVGKEKKNSSHETAFKSL